MIVNSEQAAKPAPHSDITVSKRLMLCCAGAIVACAAWAMWPALTKRDADASSSASSKALPSSTDDQARVPRAATLVALDDSAFRTPLWVAPRPAPAPPPPPPPPPPLKLQLMAIVEIDQSLAAVIFDPADQSIRTLRQGDTLGAATISKVEKLGVTVRDQWGERPLRLTPDAARRPGEQPPSPPSEEGGTQ